ncbi:MAG: hypothetical protein JSU07_01180, partial [Bacteroidetes bacterium]|nr:hypothetical protein [Bacteroidota bacterium]
MAVIYFTTFNIRAQTTTFTATTLRADTIKSTQIIKADAITAADTLKAQSHVVAKQNLEVQGNLFVNGAATFNTKILSPNGFLFDSINGLRTAVLTTGSVTTNIFSIGKQIGTTNPFPILPCSTPVNTQWFLNSGGGFASQQNNPVSNPNVNALVKLYTAQWNGSGYMEVEGVDQNAQPNNALFINYFCGRNVSICENTSLAGGGGRVQVGNFFSA